MLSELYYFNDTAISNAGVPLPVDSEEQVIFYADSVYFCFRSKKTREFVESISGRFFLTNLRIVYIPEKECGFRTFFVPLNKLFSVDNTAYLECLCDNSFIGVIFLNFKSWQNEYFFREIKRAVSKTVMDIDDTMMEGDVSQLPYYSDL